ncbi:hypothetical protein ACFGVS_07990 [Mucilaginibacter sp. AW1-7]|jgi:hypothetical protein|uniref:hypothetical protein n=1 Tax=Mucilaginibacter sp. AW1-7 TaxID=3349874 RepID=UPI003F734245
MEKLLEIVFKPSIQKYFFILPAEVCEWLLLDHEEPDGLRLCHAQMARLEEFRKLILELSLATEAMRNKAIKQAKVKVSLALLALVLVIIVIYSLKDVIIKLSPSLKWPIYICVPAVGVFSCIVIFANYITPGQSEDSLSDTVGLLEIRKRITEEFSH